MRTYLSQSDHKAIEEWVDLMLDALSLGQRDGWEGVMQRLRMVYPKVEYRMGSTRIRILWNGSGRGILL